MERRYRRARLVNAGLLEPLSPLMQLRSALATGAASPLHVVEQTIAHANQNASHNTYLSFDTEDLFRQRAALAQQGSPSVERPLWSVPISLKDCFDLAGRVTTCGSRFYAQRGPAVQSSAVAVILQSAGALITGKTHLHPLAYGITGQNPEYGDCLQPRDATLLTGGSSSGAAASVQEGSALAAIGTDTGGSIRVPAALCGLVGYRASQQLAVSWPKAWEGASHLAPSFDTLGLLLRDPRDLAPIAKALFGIARSGAIQNPRIGCVPAAFLRDCEPEVLSAFHAWKQQLAMSGARVSEIEMRDLAAESTSGHVGWGETTEIFAGIQAHEAARLHDGHYHHFEPSIRERLQWGASLSSSEVAVLHLRRQAFQAVIFELFTQFDLLMLPAAPITRLLAADDHSLTRGRILRYTTPFSLACLPALSLPGEMIGASFGSGVQLAASPGADPFLLAYAEAIGARLAVAI